MTKEGERNELTEDDRKWIQEQLDRLAARFEEEIKRWSDEWKAAAARWGKKAK